jgi:predicted transcriptional regulator of viral defense system
MKEANFIRNIFEQKAGIVSAQYLSENGVTYYDINQLLQTALITKLKRGLYKWADIETDELAEVANIVEKGVFCLQSACFYYGLTTSIPSEHHIAIADTRHVALPIYPPIKLYYWNENVYHLGVTNVIAGNQWVQMYDMEKTICDVIRHRNKIGFDVIKEVFKNYVKRKDKNLNRLDNYAKLLKIQNKINQIIEWLL